MRHLGTNSLLSCQSLILILLATSSFAQAPSSNRMSLYSDRKAHRVGDVLTIQIIESASGFNEATTEMEKENSVETSSGGGTGLLGFIPAYGVGLKNKTEHKGEGQTARRGNLQAQLAARITKILPNGDVEIEGKRTVNINSETQITELSGIVRPQDITAENVVFSYNIADAKITYKGKGAATTGQRPGLIFRLLNWIF